VTKTFLYSKGLLEKAKRRGAHRRKRERRPLPGMMLHQDGSMHVWLAGQPALDLIVTLDDCDERDLFGVLIEEEGTASTFRALMEVFGSHGLPMSLYTDRGAHYFYTADGRAAQLIARRRRRSGVPLERLGVEHIAAYSPQARGRSERVFTPCRIDWSGAGTSREIDTVEAANLFRAMSISPNKRPVRVAAAQEGTAFVAILASTLRRFYASRRASGRNDNCVSFNRLKLQIPESPLRAISSRRA